jgi:hypothetical protein
LAFYSNLNTSVYNNNLSRDRKYIPEFILKRLLGTALLQLNVAACNGASTPNNVRADGNDEHDAPYNASCNGTGFVFVLSAGVVIVGTGRG